MGEAQQKVAAAIYAEIDQKGPCTFGWLWPIANRVLGHPIPDDHGGPGYRLTDQFLQRERKKGLLKCERARGGFVWSRCAPASTVESAHG